MNAFDPTQIKIKRCGGRLSICFDHVVLTLVPQPGPPGRYQLHIQRLKPTGYIGDRIIFNDLILDNLEALALLFGCLREAEARKLHHWRG